MSSDNDTVETPKVFEFVVTVQRREVGKQYGSDASLLNYTTPELDIKALLTHLGSQHGGAKFDPHAPTIRTGRLDHSALLNALNANAISHKTYLSILQARSIWRKGVSVDQELAEIARERVGNA